MNLESLDPVAIIVMLLIGAVAGWIAGLIMKGASFGLIGNIIVGVIGAFIAGLLLPGFFQITEVPIVNSIISATIGAIILLFVISLVRRS